MTFLSLAPSTLLRSVRQAKFLSRPILFESGWNWNLKFWFLRQYGQKAIFQTKWTKNTDDLKTYLVWFSSIVWRGQFALKFFAQKIQNIWKENAAKYLCYFTSFHFKILYMGTSVPSSSFVLFQALLAWL